MSRVRASRRKADAEIRLKGWPAGDEPHDFEKLTKPLCQAIRFAYDLKRKNEDKAVPYRGPESMVHPCTLTAEEALSLERLTYSHEEQGRDALTEIMGVALRVGMEQGRRIEVTSSHRQTQAIRLTTAKLLLESGQTEQALEIINELAEANPW